MRSILRGLAAWLVAAAACTALAAAAQDLPTRVGRVAYIDGGVSIYQDPDFGWDQAYVNSPVTSQNSLWADAGSRAEMRVGGLALRIDELTQLDVSHLDDDGIDATVQRGALAIRLRHFERGASYLFSTPQAQFRLLADGRYRMDADPDGQTSRLEVFNGFAVLQSADGDVRVSAGGAIVVDSEGYHFERADRDGFDQWADSRDRYWVERTVTRYVAPDITGYEELDAYGTWIDEPGYGALWMPTRVHAGWVPYREGHWAWVSPWGWTWIDNEPWGYAPFHYGRWVQVRDRWCWYPGRRIDRQAWAPALVGWIGGSGFSVTVSSGASTPALGWYPLAPEERFHPWYRASNTYVNRVNVIVNNVTVNNVTINRGGPPPREVNRIQAATVVPRETVLRQRPVAQNVVHVAPQVVEHAPAAQPANVLPSRNDFARERPAQRAPGSRGPQDQRAAGPAAGGSLAATPAQGARPPEHPFARPAERPAPQPAPNAAAAQKPAPNAPAANPFARAPERAGRAEREAPRAAPTPNPQAPAPAAAPAAPTNRFARNPSAAPATPAASPFARPAEHDNRGARESSRSNGQAQPQLPPAATAAPQASDRQREQQQQQQERAAREAQQRAAESQRQQQQQQQQQERAAREAQQRAAESQRQQQQQQQQQERAAREAQQRAAEQQRQQQQQQQQQERAAREAQQRAAEQQRQQQQQQQAQERAAREAQQRAAEQQRQQQQQQQAQQRAAEQQQRAQQQQQERAAREAQRPPQPQHPAPPPEKNDKKDDHGSGG